MYESILAISCFIQQQSSELSQNKFLSFLCNFLLGEGSRWQEDCWVRLMDWKLSLWSGVDQYEAARSASRILKIDQDTVIKDGENKEGNVFTVENYGECKVEFMCPTKENKV